MDHVGNLFNFAWSYKISFLPILVTYIIFDSPSLVRWLTKKYYVPMYFVVFPLGHSDSLYAEYFNEGYIYRDVDSIFPLEKRRLKRRLQAHAVLSMMFACLFAPCVTGVLSALYLTPSQSVEFLAVFIVVKSLILGRAVLQARNESGVLALARNSIILVMMYVIYVFFCVIIYDKSFTWAVDSMKSDDGFFMSFLYFLIYDLLINIVFVSAITWAIQYIFTDEQNIRARESDEFVA